jgi:hypothetical protein
MGFTPKRRLKSDFDCDFWFDFLVRNYNNKKLEELNLSEIFETKEM